jgi:hypothetical protein
MAETVTQPIGQGAALEPLTVTVKEACRLTGLSVSTLYKKMAAEPPQLERRKVGARTLIVYASLKKLLGLDNVPPAQPA